MNSPERLNKILKIESKDDREREFIRFSLELIAAEKDTSLYKEVIEKMILMNNENQQKLLMQLEYIEQLSVTDPLTKLYNRLKFNEQLRLEFERFRRKRNVFSIIMFDIDHFKKVNDNYGHDIGDHVLIHMSKLVQGRLRQYDTFSRWGGEEFIVLLPEIDLNDALARAEDLRKVIASYHFIEDHPVTSSFGVATVKKQDNQSSVLKRVDEALYHAKENGRNRVSTLDMA